MGDGFSDFFYTSNDGLRLHARIYGNRQDDRPPVVCLPGLTRNAGDFHALALALSGNEKTPRQVIAFDYRGRGRSEYDRDWRNYTIATEAADISAGLTVLGVEYATFFGTSRGGLIIMALAAMRPAALKAAVLNDIGPVVEGAGLAHIRSYLENAPKPQSIEEAVRLQKATHGQAFSALSKADWERHTRALYRTENGRLTADYDPRLVKTLREIDLSLPLPAIWPQFEGLGGIPVLAIRGANSALLSAETFAEMARRHPRLEPITVEGQGHAPLLETADLPRRISAFLARAEKAAR
ncbi:alpha/beta hydrolase [Chelativorans sp. EGI FJ00035]|uniref:Alpha/beta hydrolase n=1 Tax=Chelativorans salis TaxID=2978478 RepID=A0ABT2LN61_9HYPH|nr:alpha/beta hydrolase [Chelativorans sp. EGI FJ00035]MCT7375995.1 alpha/beta hydrolase [Chelativorans sp. EGI FJ00035]